MTVRADWPRRAAAAFFALLLIVGALAGFSYGMIADENSEYRILKANAAEYACRLLGEEHPVSRALLEDAPRISQSIERDHGIAAYYPFLPAGVLLGGISRRAMMLGWHFYTFLWFTAGCAALYGIARELYGGTRRFGCMAALTLYLTPRMFADGHYNNKDMVLLSLFLLVMWKGVCWIRRGRMRDAVWMSLFGALAANTKILGAWCWGCMGLAFLADRIVRRKLDARAWRMGAAAIAVFAAGYALLTPAMWGDPIGFFKYLLTNAASFSRWDFGVLFGGRVYRPGNGDPLPWDYLPRLMLMSIPIYITLLALLGGARLARSFGARADERLRGERVPALAVLLIGGIPLVYGMAGRMVLYHSWRHFSFFYATVIVLAAGGMAEALRLWPGRRRMLAGALTAALAVNGAAIVLTHPLEGSAFNPIAALFAGDDYETDYWLLAAQPAAERLAAQGEWTVTTNRACLKLFENALSGMPEGVRARVHLTTRGDEADAVLVWNAHYREESCTSEAEWQAVVERYYGASTQEVYVPDWTNESAFEKWFEIDAFGSNIVTVYRRIEAKSQY